MSQLDPPVRGPHLARDCQAGWNGDARPIDVPDPPAMTA
jgi:hypothetical protein